MPVVWGQSESNTLLGFAADYCVICRDVRPFSVHQVHLTSHIYWIPIGAKKAVTRLATCSECQVTAPKGQESYVGFAPDFDGDLDHLIELTNPSLHSERPQDVAAHATGVDRLGAISEPFQILAPVVENLYARDPRQAKVDLTHVVSLLSPIHIIKIGPPTGTLSPGASICVLIAILVPIALLFVGIVVAGDAPAPWWSYTSAILVLVSGIIGAAVLQRSHRKSELSDHVLPLLGRSLQPLAPHLEEIRQTMKVYAAEGWRIGTALQPKQVVEAAAGVMPSVRRRRRRGAPHLDEIRTLPIGLDVRHQPNPVAATRGGGSGHEFTWVFETLVSSVERELTIVEFGSFVHQHGTWVFSNFTGKAFSRVDFAEWYACPDGVLSPGQVARDPRNWGGANQLRAGKMLWYYVGTDSNGNRFRGEAIIEQLSKLL